MKYPETYPEYEYKDYNPNYNYRDNHVGSIYVKKAHKY